MNWKNTLKLLFVALLAVGLAVAVGCDEESTDAEESESEENGEEAAVEPTEQPACQSNCECYSEVIEVGPEDSDCRDAQTAIIKCASRAEREGGELDCDEWGETDDRCEAELEEALATCW